MVEDASKPCYMFNNKVIRLWVNMVRSMDVEMMVLQHGTSSVGKMQVDQFSDWIETLQCEMDLMDETVFTCST